MTGCSPPIIRGYISCMPTNVLVVAIDGLRASSLGAYGNTTYGTPALDRFAANSFLLDCCFAPSSDLAEVYREMWQSSSVRPDATLPKVFNDLGYSTTLVTDELVLNSFAATSEFRQTVQVAAPSPSHGVVKRANGPAETDLARVFAAAMDQIANDPDDKDRLVWLHARGMYGAWDAPLEFQQMLLDDSDPLPIASTSAPDLEVTDGDDPDAPFRYATAYAAQVMALDACWEVLLDALDSASDPWLVVLIGARGFPLGEHNRIGGLDSRLFAEQLHVPWLIRFPDNRGRLARSGNLTTHQDLLPTLMDWIDRDHIYDRSTFDGTSVVPLATATNSKWRDALISASLHARAIRTPAWCLRETVVANPNAVDRSGNPPTLELYVRPDDRWEANDVAKLCPEVVDELQSRLAER